MITSEVGGTQPALNYPAYASTIRRAPSMDPIRLSGALSDLTRPVYGWWSIGDTDHDLTRQHAGDPVGQRIIVTGRVIDEDRRPVRGALVEIWQANSGGRYLHQHDDTRTALDPNFTGAGRTTTDADGRYTFITVKPGAYPWRNHHNAWRPSHIHFSLFGSEFLTRLVTQMYFPGDPLLEHDPIFNSVRDERARAQLISRFDLSVTEPGWALGYAFDIVLRGRDATPFEERV